MEPSTKSPNRSGTDSPTPSLDEASLALLKKEKVVIIGSLILATIMAWFYLIAFESRMGDMRGPLDTMIFLKPWTVPYAGSMFHMWTIMMSGMMIPSVGVVILTYARIQRSRMQGRLSVPPTATFLGGYLVMWTAFSLVATAIQCGLETAALMTPVMSTARPEVATFILILTGIYQLTPLKKASLSHCRSPMDYLMRGWRNGISGAFRMGLGHGAICIGCCWALMMLLFVGGVINLLLVATITIFIVLEKTAPFGLALGRFAGYALILLGTWTLLG